MKRLLLALLLPIVGTITAAPAQAQTLTLDELIKISKQSFINADAYLSGKGWQLDMLPASANNDSTSKAAWFIDIRNAKHEPQRISEVLLIWKTSPPTFPILVYHTSSRRSFDAIKARVLSYNMEEQGGFSDSTGIGSMYYGATYETILHISPSTIDDPLCYAAQLQLHGLTKMYSIQDDGSTKTEWRKLIMYGWKAFKDEGAVIRAQPDASSKVLQRVAKGDLVIIPEGYSQECPECGEDYYRASFISDEIKPIDLGVPLGSKGYVLKSDLKYGRLSPE